MENNYPQTPPLKTQTSKMSSIGGSSILMDSEIFDEGDYDPNGSDFDPNEVTTENSPDGAQFDNIGSIDKEKSN